VQPEKYEQRLRGLLDAFQLALELGAPVELMSRFLVMGGECNYLLGVRVERTSVRLEPVPGALWKNGRCLRSW
jgi:IMP and pyridine-specific 5'-nucleotidase